MPYIGKQPQVGNYIKLDTITTSATTTFNLTAGGVAVYPQTATNCIVSLNGIIQAPTDAYTISGSTIVFASALTTSDVIDFITVLGDVLNIGTPSDGTVGFAKVTSNLITGATAETSIDGADSILIYDDSATALRKMTRTNFVSGLSVANTPAFSAYSSSQQTITSGTWTKLNYGNEIYDTNTAYDTSTSRFTAPTAGKYFASAYIAFDTASTFSGRLMIRKNNSGYLSGGGYYVNTAYYALMVSGVVELAVNDYIEAFLYAWSVNVTTYGAGQELGQFQAFKLIGV